MKLNLCALATGKCLHFKVYTMVDTTYSLLLCDNGM